MLRRVSNPGGTPTISGQHPYCRVRDRPANHRAAPREPGWRERTARRRRRSTDLRKSRERPAVDGAHDWRHSYRRGERFGQPQRRALVRARLADRRRPRSCSRVRCSRAPVPAASTSATTGCRRSRLRRAGRTVIGFSAAGASEFINAGVAERFSSDARRQSCARRSSIRPPRRPTTRRGTPARPTRGRRWGGVSSTVVDGCDGSTIWTLQQFTDSVNSYGLAVARTVGPGAATPVGVTPSVIASGVASIDLQVTATSSGGTAFFDPGAGLSLPDRR